MGFELIKSSVSKIFHPEAPDYSPVIIGILVFSILVKCYMALYNRSIGSRIGSVAMKATAIDSLSDMIATTVVLIGTIVSATSGIIIDGYCGVLVGMFILYSGFVAAKDTINFEACQSDDRGCRIRQVVECICCDGDGMTEKACQSLGSEQDQVEKNPDDTAEHSICLANAGIRNVFIILDK